MKNTQVEDIMTENPVIIDPESTLQVAAQSMEQIDCGVLPVGDSKTLIGMITDRDIVLRAIAKGKDPREERVRDYMTTRVFACNEDDFLEDAAEKMRDYNVSRLIVRNHKGDVTGILSFGSILRKSADAKDITSVIKHAVHKIAA